MNSFALANEVSWTLQSAIAIAFAMALAGLASHLKRPATRALALAWVWTTIGLTAVAVQSFVDRDGEVQLVDVLLGACTLAGILGSIPALRSAVDTLSGVRNDTGFRPLVLSSVRWALSACGIVLGLWLLGIGPLAFIDRFLGIAGRLVIVIVYVQITFHVLAQRRRTDARFAGLLGMFAAATLLQALRPLLVLLVFKGRFTGPMSDLGATVFVGFHVFAGTALGIACLLLALAEERAAMLESGRQLRDAALRLERSHRLESVGRLASGVAHDFNNLLTVITSSAGLARQPDQPHTQIVDELAEIEKAAERGAGLTRQLLAYARRQPQHVLEFDVGERLQHMSSLLDRLVGRGIVLDVVVPMSSAVVAMDPVTFEQVVVNLVANARDAIADAGRITVTVSMTLLESPRPLADGDLCPGSYVTLTVADTGRGIAPEVMDQLFEPFFTTRQDEGGTGLGLATVHGIVRQSGGDVTVESQLGTGTAFTVLFPALRRDAALASARDTAPAAY